MKNNEIKATETLIDAENMAEAKEVMDFMDILNNAQKKEFLSFIRGARFAVSIAQAKTA